LILFFQAEDGIRDDLVTGVQTCALPICVRRAPWTAIAERAAAHEPVPFRQVAFLRGVTRGMAIVAMSCDDHVAPALDRILRVRRSEERRVGKECSSEHCRASASTNKNMR